MGFAGGGVSWVRLLQGWLRGALTLAALRILGFGAAALEAWILGYTVSGVFVELAVGPVALGRAWVVCGRFSWGFRPRLPSGAASRLAVDWAAG